MAFEYVTKAANDMYEILDRETIHLEESHLHDAAAIGCNTLRQTMREQESLDKIVSHLQAVREHDRETFYQVVGDFNHFTNHFLVLEENTLVRAGIRLELAEAINRQAQNLQTSIATWESNPDDVKSNIGQLEHYVCTLADDLERRKVTPEMKSGHHRDLKWTTTGIASIATVVINHIALGDGYLSPAEAAASNTVGEAILGLSLGKIL